MKVMLKCTTVDGGIVCVVAHLHLEQKRQPQSAGNWGTTVLEEESFPITEVLMHCPVIDHLRPTSLAQVVRVL